AAATRSRPLPVGVTDLGRSPPNPADAWWLENYAVIRIAPLGVRAGRGSAAPGNHVRVATQVAPTAAWPRDPGHAIGDPRSAIRDPPSAIGHRPLGRAIMRA